MHKRERTWCVAKAQMVVYGVQASTNLGGELYVQSQDDVSSEDQMMACF